MRVSTLIFLSSDLLEVEIRYSYKNPYCVCIFSFFYEMSPKNLKNIF